MSKSPAPISLTQTGRDFVHNLKTVSALGEAAPRIDNFDHITIAENDELALASVAVRLGREAECHAALENLLGGVPDVGRTILRDPEAGFWMGPEQWMIGAPRATHELLADQLKERFGDAASVTEQSGAWATFDVTGAMMREMSERLCNIPIRRMVAGDVHRTVIHQLGCFVIRREAEDHIRILGPRASAKNLHHALLTAAHALA